jgi:hypothetical protein
LIVAGDARPGAPIGLWRLDGMALPTARLATNGNGGGPDALAPADSEPSTWTVAGQLTRPT